MMTISVGFAALLPLSCLLGSILCLSLSPGEYYNKGEGKIAMAIQLIKKCLNCGNDDLLRIYRKWYMRLIPFTKRYCCNVCRSKLMVNFWATIILMSITSPLRLIIFILCRLSGLSILWQETHPPMFSSEEESWRVLNQFQCWKKYKKTYISIYQKKMRMNYHTDASFVEITHFSLAILRNQIQTKCWYIASVLNVMKNRNPKA